MKRLFKIFSIVLVSVFMFNVDAKETKTKLPEANREPVNLYIFRSETCPYCHDAMEYFGNKIDEKYLPYFKVISIEVNDPTNSTLHVETANYFGDEAGGIPYIVVGDSYHQSGFDENEIAPLIIDAILKEYTNDEYIDVVSTIKVDKNIEVEEKSNETYSNITEYADTSSSDKADSNDTIIIIAIFVVVIGGIAGLVIASRK